MSKPRLTKPPLKTGPIVVTCIRDLKDFEKLEEGARIATNNNLCLILEDYKGTKQWFEEGQLTSWKEPQARWLPAIVLPPVQS